MKHKLLTTLTFLGATTTCLVPAVLTSCKNKKEENHATAYGYDYGQEVTKNVVQQTNINILPGAFDCTHVWIKMDAEYKVEDFEISLDNDSLTINVTPKIFDKYYLIIGVAFKEEPTVKTTANFNVILKHNTGWKQTVKGFTFTYEKTGMPIFTIKNKHEDAAKQGVYQHPRIATFTAYAGTGFKADKVKILRTKTTSRNNKFIDCQLGKTTISENKTAINFQVKMTFTNAGLKAGDSLGFDCWLMGLNESGGSVWLTKVSGLQMTVDKPAE